MEEEILSSGRGHEAEEVAVARATIKGKAVRRLLACESDDRLNRASVLSADTVVHIDSDLLDKPSDHDQARVFLTRLAGQEHGVITALWLWHQGQEYQRWVRTWVRFGEISSDLIEAYIRTGEPFDKAGGYGIQGVGATLVESIRGCYFNVMGLPLFVTSRLFSEVGISWELDSSF